MVRLSGFAFASAINSFSEFADTFGLPMRNSGEVVAIVSGMKSRCGSYGSLL